VKLYADEPGSEQIRRLSNIVVSALARIEVPAAIWRKQRLGELSVDDAGVLVDEFGWDWRCEPAGEIAFAVVAVTEPVLDEAARVVARHPLRAYDAVQLASALAARTADPELTRFACFDEELARAARAEGFAAA
jgi:predicted nucleic acid-binding protein